MSAGGSKHSINEATRSRATFSKHGRSLGAAGFISPYDESQDADFLSKPGETAIVNPPKEGMQTFEIGAAWDNVVPKGSKKKTGLLDKILGKGVDNTPMPKGVDLDVGCLYELQDGQRGAIQAFGKRFGSFDEPPFMALSGDERTGDTEGEDEMIATDSVCSKVFAGHNALIPCFVRFAGV
ncbi:MAG: hypothetical protein AAF988_06695, partial [Pseudomonadota bacterium]